MTNRECLRLATAKYINSLPVKDNMPGQKFPRGALVKVCDKMPPSMRQFDSGFRAIVEHTYAQKYWGSNVESYSLIKLDENDNPIGSSAWYYECQLTLISDDIQAGLKIIEEYQKWQIEKLENNDERRI